jgi:hypothetical protein
VQDLNRDLEKGEMHSKVLNEISRPDTTSKISLPASLECIFGKYLTVSQLTLPTSIR